MVAKTKGKKSDDGSVWERKKNQNQKEDNILLSSVTFVFFGRVHDEVYVLEKALYEPKFFFPDQFDVIFIFIYQKKKEKKHKSSLDSFDITKKQNKTALF